jgi:hypothetical protein
VAIAVGIFAYTSPPSQTAASTTSPKAVLSTWSAGYATKSIQDNSASVHYSSGWIRVSHRGYSHGTVRSTNKRGATASLTFTGTGVSWVGPTGPTRGRAKVYVNGVYKATVNLFSTTFRPSRVVFRMTWKSSATRTIKIVAAGTAGRPTVAVDALLVRGKAKTTTNKPATTKPKPTSAAQPRTTTTAGVTVTSIAALKKALADNSITSIVVKNGTYHVSAASANKADSLWIGDKFAGRTNPVTVRAETRGGVIFDGGGSSTFGGISFEDGAHHQTWDGFTFANGKPTATGVVVFGGYRNGSVSPHHITMRHIKVLRSVTGSVPQDHAFYISASPGAGPNNLLFEDIDVDARGGIMSAFNFGHDFVHNAWNVTVRRLTVTGANTAIVVWRGGGDPIHDLTFEDITISNSARFAVRFEDPNDSDILFKDITSTGSGTQGFYSSYGDKPPGVTLTGNHFD